MLKDEVGFILIGFEFPEFEGKNYQMNIGNNEKRLKVHACRNLTTDFY